MNRPSPGTLFLGLAAILFCSACHWFSPAGAARSAPAETLAPSPRLMVGRVIAIDGERHFAFVELAPDAPLTALADGTELTTRTQELAPTGKLRASRYVRGRTLGATILEGQPTPGDEVVWLAP